jgi:hypothetical protein
MVATDMGGKLRLPCSFRKRELAETYGNDPDLLKALAAPGTIGKAAMTPAQTTVSGWAAELSTPTILDTVQIVAPQSVYGQLSSCAGAIRVSLAGRQSVKVPTADPGAERSAKRHDSQISHIGDPP